MTNRELEKTVDALMVRIRMASLQGGNLLPIKFTPAEASLIVDALDCYFLKYQHTAQGRNKFRY
jgi:hypothetical protein